MDILHSDTSVIIGFSRPHGFSLISSAIKAVERTPYSHVYLRFYSKSLNRWLVYHASHTNLHFMSLDTFKAKNEILEEYELTGTDDQKTAALQFCVDKAGLPYGMLEIVGMGWVRLVKAWFDKEINNPFRDGTRTQVCSEVIFKILRIYGIEVKDRYFEHEGPRKVRELIVANQIQLLTK